MVLRVVGRVARPERQRWAWDASTSFHPYRHSSRPSQGLPHSPTKRLDRVALQRMLESLGYLTLTLVRPATSWPACWLVATSLPRMTVATACRFPIHRFAARNRWQPPRQRIKYVTVTHAAIAPSSRSPRPTFVNPLTASGLVHPGSGGSLLHSFASPRTVTMI